MKILVDKREFGYKEDKAISTIPLELVASTSVNFQKAHFFETIEMIGDICPVDHTLSDDYLTSLCSEPDAIFATFHEEPREGIACRLCQHTKGDLMLIGGLMDSRTFHDATLNLLTSVKQKDQLINGLGPAAPKMEVFTPRLSGEFYMTGQDEMQRARIKNNINPDCFHMIYAGRFIANKGICQLVRAMNLWHIPNTQLTLLGSFEPNFHISQSNALHVTFADFFRREILELSKNIHLSVKPAVAQKELREIYWSADCFLYPSFHEDENFGMAPREAILCGVPAVVTDFCGLGFLSQTRGGIIRTYPTLGGVRYSLKSLRQEIESVRNWSRHKHNENRAYNASIVKNECDPLFNRKVFQKALEELCNVPTGLATSEGRRSKDRADRWAYIGPDSFKTAIALAGSNPPEGLYVDGNGYASDGWFSEPHFLHAIQSFYTTNPKPPVVRQDVCYRGFWRIALWNEEQALIEFGFPGPRIKRYKQTEWAEIISASVIGLNGETEFYPRTSFAVNLIQQLVDLGYLVPDDL